MTLIKAKWMSQVHHVQLPKCCTFSKVVYTNAHAALLPDLQCVHWSYYT